MKAVKVINLILSIFLVVVGTIYEIYPPAISKPVFYACWVVGIIAIVMFAIILYVEKKNRKE